MAGFNGYQSGGIGFNSPDKIIENATNREFMQQAGGKDGLASKDQADVVKILNNILDQLVQNTNISNEQTNEIKSALHEKIMGAPNTPQAAKEGTSLLNSFIRSNPELIKGLSQQKWTTGAERSNLGAISNSSLKQLVLLNQGILNTLKQIAVGINQNTGAFQKFNADFIEIDVSNDKQQEKQNQAQLDKLGLLQQVIAFGLFHSPTATKLQQLGSSLMGLGLMKVMGSGVPEPLKKLAAGAIYLEIPQTLMAIIGTVVSQSLSDWLTNSLSNLFKDGIMEGLVNPAKDLFGKATNLFTQVGSLIKNVFGQIGSAFMRMLPMMTNPLVIGGALLVAGIAATVAGVMAHRKKMKENDAKIDSDPTLSADQKEREKLKAHTASGARAGIVGGALTGAGIGFMIGGPIGGAIGGLIGLVAGPLIGAIVGGWKHFGIIGKDLKAGFTKGMHAVGEKVVQGARWASEHKDQLLNVLKPIGKVLLTILEMSSPFFILFKMFANAASKFFNFGKNNNDNGGGGNSVVNKILHPFRTKKEGEMAKQLGSGFVNMRDLGLKGSISSGNSIPFIKKENANNVKFLDDFFTSRGYKIDYTSAMGGGHAGGARSHASGNKLDYVLYKNGKQVQATKAEEAILKQMGFIHANGAIGYHANADGPGFHNDSHIGSGINLQATSEGRAWLAKKAEDDAKKAKKAEDDEAKWRKEHPTQAKIKDAIQHVRQAPSANSNNKSDPTGIQDYTNKQNTTNKIANGGVY